MNALFERLKFLSSETVLGTMIVVLSIFTAVSGYQGSMSDSEQTKYNVLGQKTLTDANAEYLSSNQMIVYDYSMYDGWYTADTEEKEEYYLANFSEELQTAISLNDEDAFSDAYYDAMYTGPNDLFAQADVYFDNAEMFNNRGDKLQLVMLIMALGLAFAAWASLQKEESRMRVLFAILSIVMLIYGVFTYLTVPTVVV
jgi:hypothetical protein